ncbi:MAG: hypothetical protein HQ567_28885 [Candidatus Nealsonbacteria bacterium]|nr:hypothetical protein [Candidatus Nealsonbacteria bacterium]
MPEAEDQNAQSAAPKPKAKAVDAVDAAADSPGKLARLKKLVGRMFSRKWIAGLLILSIVVHLAGIVYYQVFATGGRTAPDPEIALGEFEFAADKSELGQITAAKFQLHISPLEQVDREARYRLYNREFRVRQDIEELLRQAHSGDFLDPKLAELKRRLQEQVNATLGMRVIADVIITDLKLERRALEEVEAIAEAAEPAPWLEQPAVKNEPGEQDNDLTVSVETL